MMGAKVKGKVGKRSRSATVHFWSCLRADEKRNAYWRRYTERTYRRSQIDEPMPGIWPKYCARVEVGMVIFQALEERGKEVPAGFLSDPAEMDIQDVDCYAISERLLDDDMVQRFGDGPGRIAKKGRTKRKGR